VPAPEIKSPNSSEDTTAKAVPAGIDGPGRASPQRPREEPSPARKRGAMAELTPTLRALAVASQIGHAVAPQLITRYVARHFMRPRRKPGYDYRPALPAGATRLAVPHRGLELTAWVWGDSGPSLLLMHGWENHAGSMLRFVQPLLDRGYRVFALDAPGHGLSPSTPTHLLDFSAAIEAMQRAYGPFENVVAHSFGATATCLMLSRAPDLHPQRMTLISPMQGLDQHLEVFADIALLTVERAERLRQRVERELNVSVEQICALRAVRNINVPGLVIHDLHDPVIPHEAGELLSKEWPGARLISTSRLGHHRILRCPNVLKEVLRHHAAV
jgi:pimeloyl-ACP methyl ester carboxylesterase